MLGVTIPVAKRTGATLALLTRVVVPAVTSSLRETAAVGPGGDVLAVPRCGDFERDSSLLILKGTATAGMPHLPQ